MNAPTNLPALLPDPAHAPHNAFSPARQGAFLAALAECGSVRSAAAHAGVSHQTAYRLRRASASFRLGWDAALLAARVHAEGVLAARALDGVEEAVFYHGEEVARRRRYDSRLLLAHLARLDKLAARADVAALAGDFEQMLARIAAGEAIAPATPPGAAPEGRSAEDLGEEGFFAPGQCNMRSTPPTDCADEGEGAGEFGEPQGPLYDERLIAMYAARPRSAPPLAELGEEWVVEWLQVHAFEAGEEEWWLLGEGDL